MTHLRDGTAIIREGMADAAAHTVVIIRESG